MKALIKPNHLEARYDDVQGFQIDLEIRCGWDRSCRRRNSCDEQNGADGEVLDEILF